MEALRATTRLQVIKLGRGGIKMQNDLKKIMAILYEIKKRINKLEKDLIKNDESKKEIKL